MKTVFNFMAFGLLAFEILSPFLLGYLNAANNKPDYAVKTQNKKIKIPSYETWQQAPEISSMEPFDELYCDSKSIRMKE